MKPDFHPLTPQRWDDVAALFGARVARGWRRKGVTVQLLRAAVKHVRRCGGRIVEGYPVLPKPYHTSSAAFAWTSFAPAFEAAGFRDCAGRSRPIMRRRA